MADDRRQSPRQLGLVSLPEVGGVGGSPLPGSPPPAPSPPLPGRTLRPDVSITPSPSQGIAADRSGKLPVSIPAQSLVATDRHPDDPKIGQLWYRQDMNEICIKDDDGNIYCFSVDCPCSQVSDVLIPGGYDYISVQTGFLTAYAGALRGAFGWGTGGVPTDTPIPNWAPITTTDGVAQFAAGRRLYARYYFLNDIAVTFGNVKADGLNAVAADGRTTQYAGALLESSSFGNPVYTPTAQTEAIGSRVADGILVLNWVDPAGPFPADLVSLSQLSLIYQARSEKGQASGYASLDSGTKVPAAQQGTGSASASVFLRGDRAWAAVTDALLSLSDITTNNVSTTKHGFAPKLPNDATKYLDGTGAYTTPAGGSGGPPSGAAGGVLDGTYPNPGIAASVAGDGLAETADVLSVNVDGSTIEINTDTLRVKDAGISAAKLSPSPTSNNGKWLRLASGALVWNSISAVDVAVVDSGNYFAGTDVEAVLQEVGAEVTGGGTILALLPLWGDGSDGSASFDGTNTFAFATTTGAAPNLVYTLTRDIYLASMSVSAGKIINTGGYRVYVAGTLTNSGTIRNNGGDASGTTAGTASGFGVLNAGGGGSGGIASGTTTVAGTVGTATNSSYVNYGGKGGAGGGLSGGNGGAVNTPVRMPGMRDLLSLSFGSFIPGGPITSAAPTASIPAPGTGGGSGGRTTGASATATGASGGGGGALHIFAKIIVNTGGVISTNGGNGGNATGAGVCASGGGGGGGGGVLVLVYNSLTTGTETASGGTKGSGLNGAALASDGNPGLVVKLASV